MKVTHLSLARPVQTANGPIRGTLSAEDGYVMCLHLRQGLIEVNHPNWVTAKGEQKPPVYLSRAAVDAVALAEPIPQK